jgi:hypothetical protein
MEPDVGAIRTPDVRPPCPRSAASPVRGHPLGRMRRTQGRCGSDRLDPSRLPQPRHAFGMHGLPLAASPGGPPPHAILRRVRLLFGEPPHPQARLGTLPRRLVRVRGPGHPPAVTLPRHAHLGRRGLHQRPLRRRRHRPLVCSARPTPLCVGQCVGRTALGMPPGRARAWRVGPRKSRASPGGDGASRAPSASEAPRVCGLMREPFAAL